jgi:hypothetical protein
VFAAESLAAAFACFFGFAVFVPVFVAPVFEVEAEVCASAPRGETQAYISARAQPAPSHLRIFARPFRFGPTAILKLRMPRRSAPK